MTTQKQKRNPIDWKSAEGQRMEAIIRKEYPTGLAREIAERLGISYDTILKKAQYMGIRKAEGFKPPRPTKQAKTPRVGKHNPENQAVKTKRKDGSVMIGGVFVKPDRDMTFEKATQGRVAVVVTLNGKPLTVFALPGKEQEVRAKYANHNVEPPRSYNRAGGHAI